MICPNCGREINDNSVFCPFCNTDLLNKNAISFDQLNDGMERLRKEAKKAFTISIVSLVFFSGFLGIFLAIWNMSKIDALNRMNFFPTSVNDIDEYETLKKKLRTSKKLCIVSIIMFAVSMVASPIILYLLTGTLY